MSFQLDELGKKNPKIQYSLNCGTLPSYSSLSRVEVGGWEKDG